VTLIVLHNTDTQGKRARAAFGRLNCPVLEVRFVNSDIHPATIHQIRQLAARFSGPNTVVWMGHGNESRRHENLRGHPLTGGRRPRRISSQGLIHAFRLLNPNKIYLFTCMAMRWVQREAHTFYDEFLFLNSRVKIFAARTRISGASLTPLVNSLAAGVENPPGPFGQGTTFEMIEVYGENFLEWRQRVSPQRTNQGAWEAPF